MTDIIHHIRKQSEKTRRNILYLLTVMFAVILVCLWVYSLGYSFTSTATQAGINQDIQPFSNAYLKAQENSL